MYFEIEFQEILETHEEICKKPLKITQKNEWNWTKNILQDFVNENFFQLKSQKCVLKKFGFWDIEKKQNACFSRGFRQLISGQNGRRSKCATFLKIICVIGTRIKL